MSQRSSAPVFYDIEASGLDDREAKRQALQLAPPIHRAEADAGHWAMLWAFVVPPRPSRAG
jgi:hypothetical protein